MRFVYYLCLTLLVTAFVNARENEIPFKKVGEIKARSAQDIVASNWSVGAETMDRDYTIYENWKEYLGPLGFKKARIQGGWNKTEPKKAHYRWDWLDAIIPNMVSQGVEPWVCLCYGNANYSEGGGTRLGASIPKTEEAQQAWKQWVAAFVVRYKDYVNEWEVWNEPNQGNSPEFYADFLILTAETIRDIQPKAKIIAMSTAGVKLDFVEGVLSYLQEKGKLHLVDQVTYHPYAYNPDSVYDRVADLRESIAKYSSRIHIRQGENGAPSERRRTKALSGHDWSETSQAKWALRRLLGDLGRDIQSSYFAIMDMNYPDEINRKGLLHATPKQTVDHVKPAYYALQHLASVFDHTLERIPHYAYHYQGDLSLSLFGYENRFSKKQVISYWNDADRPSDKNEYHDIKLVFSRANFTEPVLVDLRTGNVFDIPEENYSIKGTVLQIESLPCYDSPLLIAEKSCLHLKMDKE